MYHTMLSEDLCVFNVTRDTITQRRAVVPDLAWPVPSHRHGQERPAMEHHDILPMSQWLRDAEIPVDGVETEILDS